MLKEIHHTENYTTLKELLVANNITQEQLARIMKCNRTTVSRLLNNDKSLSFTQLEYILSIIGYRAEIVITKK